MNVSLYCIDHNFIEPRRWLFFEKIADLFFVSLPAITCVNKIIVVNNYFNFPSSSAIVIIMITLKIIVLHSFRGSIYMYMVWKGVDGVHVYIHCKASLFIVIIVNTVD